jgi:hypothetical protein
MSDSSDFYPPSGGGGVDEGADYAWTGNHSWLLPLDINGGLIQRIGDNLRMDDLPSGSYMYVGVGGSAISAGLSTVDQSQVVCRTDGEVRINAGMAVSTRQWKFQSDGKLAIPSDLNIGGQNVRYTGTGALILTTALASSGIRLRPDELEGTHQISLDNVNGLQYSRDGLIWKFNQGGIFSCPASVEVFGDNQGIRSGTNTEQSLFFGGDSTVLQGGNGDSAILMRPNPTLSTNQSVFKKVGAPSFPSALLTSPNQVVVKEYLDTVISAVVDSLVAQIGPSVNSTATQLAVTNALAAKVWSTDNEVT